MMKKWFRTQLKINGNTTHVGRTGQDLAWNELNLISGVSTTSGGNTSQLASYTWMADGAKYASARADGAGYVYKGALVFEHDAAGKLSLDTANHWRYSGKEEQQALNSAIDEYKLFSRNCTTTVSDVLNSAGSSVLKETVNQPTGSIGIYTYTSTPVTHTFVHPRSLQHHLKHNRNNPASYVKK